jgi:hypothetical protein
LASMSKIIESKYISWIETEQVERYLHMNEKWIQAAWMREWSRSSTWTTWLQSKVRAAAGSFLRKGTCDPPPHTISSTKKNSRDWMLKGTSLAKINFRWKHFNYTLPYPFGQIKDARCLMLDAWFYTV